MSVSVVCVGRELLREGLESDAYVEFVDVTLYQRLVRPSVGLKRSAEVGQLAREVVHAHTVLDEGRQLLLSVTHDSC